MKWIWINDQLINLTRCTDILMATDFTDPEYQGILFRFEDSYNRRYETSNYPEVIAIVMRFLNSSDEHILNLQEVLDETN